MNNYKLEYDNLITRQLFRNMDRNVLEGMCSYEEFVEKHIVKTSKICYNYNNNYKDGGIVADDNFFRFALILSDGQAPTFEKNLAKIIKPILFDNYGQALTIPEILNYCSKLYALDFTYGEVDLVLNNAKFGFIKVAGVSTSNTKYDITPAEYDKLKNKYDKYKIDKIIDTFKEFQADISCTKDEIKNVVSKYIYELFNNDVSSILSLLHTGNNDLTASMDRYNFTPNEKIILNTFFNWDNKEKNVFIYNVVSSCYEYCMMTVKKDSGYIKSLISGKSFYLDTSILFRLLGFNNDDRQQSIQKFISRCESTGVELKMTTFTHREFFATLDNHVNRLTNLLRGQQAPSYDVAKTLIGNCDVDNFYKKYVQWSKNTVCEYNDYRSFKGYLTEECIKQLEKIKCSNPPGYVYNNDDLFKSLLAFKANLGKNYNALSIETDVANYIYIKELNAKCDIQNFSDVKAFFISADQSQIAWTKQQSKSVTSCFLLPSVLYSLLLKYDGRTATDDDYATFCQFVNQRIPYVEDELQSKKEEIFRHIARMGESTSIKDSLIIKINNEMLTEEYKDYAAEKIVEIAQNQMTKEFREQIEDLASDVNQIKTDSQTLIDEATSSGKIQGQDDVIAFQIGRIYTRNKFISISMWGIVAIGIIIIITISIALLIKGNMSDTSAVMIFINNNSILIRWVSSLISILVTIIQIIFNRGNILSTDKKIIEEKYRIKLKKYQV